MDTLLPRAWLRHCRQGLCLATLASLLPLPLSAADEKPQVVLQFVDAETKAPLAGARVVMPVVVSDPRYVSVMLPSDPLSEPAPLPLPPGVPPPPAREHRAITDANGMASLPAPQPGTGIAVLHEKGVAWLGNDAWNGDGTPIPVRLQAWSRIEGRVFNKEGRASVGVVISVARQSEHVGIGSTISYYASPLQHGTWTVTDEQGRFTFDQMLPTSVDGDYDVPYTVSQIVRTGDAPSLQRKPEPGTLAGWGMGPVATVGEVRISLGRGTIALEPGQRGEVELEALPRCVREVSGRLVLPDGTPFVPQPDARYGGATIGPSFFPKIKSVGMIIGVGGSQVIQNDGRFTVTLPLAGRWRISLSDHEFRGDKSEFEFSLPGPVGDSERGEPVDLGDIVVQPRRDPGNAKPPIAAVDGQFESSLRVTDEAGRIVDAVTVSIEQLEARLSNGSRYHHPSGIPAPRRERDGSIHFKVPATFPNRDNGVMDKGKTWDVTHVRVKLECPGYETLAITIAAGSKGTVVVMKRLATCRLRVTLEGRPLKQREVHLRVGWQMHGSYSASSGWSEDKSSGVLTHSNVPPGRWQVQAAHLANDGWRWFSEAREMEANVDGSEVIEIPLKRGALLAGRIGDDVPRPIRQGMARVMVIMPEVTNAESYRIFWTDWQNLDEGGHFSFKGLPAGETWIAASCDGWISPEWKPTGKNRFKSAGWMTWGGSSSMEWTSQPVTLNGDVRDHIVPMTRSGACVLKFSEPDGSPVRSADLWWDPRLRSGGLITEDLASTDRALDHLLRGPSEGGYPTGAFLPRAQRKTGANGEVYVGNIPPGKVRFSLRHDKGSFHPVDEAVAVGWHPYDYSAPFRVEIKSGEKVRAEFVVKRGEW